MFCGNIEFVRNYQHKSGGCFDERYSNQFKLKLSSLAVTTGQAIIVGRLDIYNVFLGQILLPFII